MQVTIKITIEESLTLQGILSFVGSYFKERDMLREVQEACTTFSNKIEKARTKALTHYIKY